MCYHYSVTATRKELEKRYKAEAPQLELFSPVYHANGFKYLSMPIIKQGNEKEITLCSWGLIPFWNKDYTKAMIARSRTLNARAETVFELASYRLPIIKNRCLIPATSFFEWMHDKENDKIVYPFNISLRSSEIFSLAGIYDVCTLEKTEGDKQKFETFSIITTDANPFMSVIHNKKDRMPLIIPKELEHAWLNPELNTKEAQGQISEYLRSYDELDMKAHTISRAIASPKTNSNVPSILEKVDYPELDFNTLFKGTNSLL